VKQLHQWYGDRITFLDVVIRQAHPGEKRGRYLDYGDKLESAREYQRLEGIDWPVLVDDYAGTVHRQYSKEMADPSFLIDAEGKVAFYGMWTHGPALKRAFDELLARGGTGAPVAGGIDRMPHMLASIVDGYRGPARGGRRAVRELDTAGLGIGTLSRLGSWAKPVLGPIALRAEPLRPAAKTALMTGLLGAVVATRLAGARRRAGGPPR
jgi:hypothetical protein